MGKCFTISLRVPPTAKGRPRSVLINGQVRNLTPAATRQSEQKIRIILKSLYRESPMEGPISLKCNFYIERPKTVKRPFVTTRPDLDNYIKQIMDCGNGLLWKDDSQIYSVLATKEYGEPRIEIVVEEMT